MKNKAFLISIYVVIAMTLNACAPKIQAAAASAPAPTATVVASPTSAPVTNATNTPSMFSATLSEVAGKAEVKLSGQDAFTPAQVNSMLDENGQAMTGSDGKIRLDLSTGTIVRVAPNSLFTLISNEPVDNSLKTRFQLAIGKIFIILNGGSMEVDTPTGTAAVRGSYMSVSYDSNSGAVRITCLEGNCSLRSAGGNVEITFGQTAIITGVGQPPQVGKMSDNDIQDWLNFNPEAKVIVDTLLPSTPPPTTVVGAPPPLVVPPAVVRRIVEEDPEPTIPTATSKPLLVPTVEFLSVDPISPAPVVGETFYMTISVQSSTNGPFPTGTVKVRAGGTYICTAPLEEGGFAFCASGIPATGNYDLIAEYPGDANYSAKSVAWSNFSVSPASTTTTIVSQSPNPSLLSNLVSFTATVDVVTPGAGLPTGKVTFMAGAYSCEALSAPWTCSIQLINPGPTFVNAIYSGDTNFTGSSSSSVTQEVLLNSDTEFRTVTGPTSIIAVCDQFYQVEALDFNGVNAVSVEYSVNDNTFSSPGAFPLTNTGNFFWEGTSPVSAAVNDTVYWRFIATDNTANQTFFGGTIPYTNGYTGSPVDAYSFISGVACP
jgi:hypothetical protein